MLAALLFTVLPAPRAEAASIEYTYVDGLISKFVLKTGSAVYTVYPASTSNWVSKGSAGSLVRVAQAYCRAAGFSVGSAGVDGVFGNDTFNAVVKYQRGHSLLIDGVVGVGTWRQMASTYKDMACKFL